MTAGMGADRDLPSTIVHKLARLMCGTNSFVSLTHAEQQAIFNAMQRVREAGQSNTRWHRRAAGILIKEGWARHLDTAETAANRSAA